MKRMLLLLCPLLLALTGAGAFFLTGRPKPQYGWLVFGPEGATRVLASFRGEALTLVGAADGRPDRPHASFKSWRQCRDVLIVGRDGGTTYLIKRVSGSRGSPLFHVDIRGPLAYQAYCDLALGDDPDTAPVAHFHGPLTVQAQEANWQLSPDLALRRGDEPTDLRAYVGTFDAARRCWVVVCSEDSYRPKEPLFPAGVCPVVEVEFPGPDGGTPLRRTYPLDGVC